MNTYAKKLHAMHFVNLTQTMALKMLIKKDLTKITYGSDLLYKKQQSGYIHTVTIRSLENFNLVDFKNYRARYYKKMSENFLFEPRFVIFS